MKALLVRFAQVLAPVVDLALMFIALPAAIVLAVYRRLGSRRLPLTTAGLKRIGVFPIRSHYYEPLFDDRLLKKPLDTPRLLPGIDFNTTGQLELLSRLVHGEEFRHFVETEKEK